MSQPNPPPRYAVVDLGSNSVRLVVYEGHVRNPLAIFNEKAVLRLGRGMQASGLLNEEGVRQAVTVMDRYHAVARAMGAAPMEVLATAAVRDAINGPGFVEELQSRMPDVAIRVLTGEQEAELSAAGVLCGIPAADGVLADIGGGSLELVRVRSGTAGEAHTLKLGVIRLAERSGGETSRARGIAEADLAGVPWLHEAAGLNLYAVGGAFRALARLHMAQTNYPLNIVHHYAIEREEARAMAGMITVAGRRVLERLPGAPRRRLDDLPYAALVLRRLLRATGARRVVFSANGLREGWLMQRMPAEVCAEDPLLAAGRDMALRLGRDPSLPPALFNWTSPLFIGDSPADNNLRLAACWMSDAGSRDHPEYRAEQAFWRVLRQPGVALDHHGRAFLALCLALRYEADPEALYLRCARELLDVASSRRAEILGNALRLAYTLSAGTKPLLAGTSLESTSRRLVLHLAEGAGVFVGDSIQRRLDRLAQVVGLEGVIELSRL